MRFKYNPWVSLVAALLLATILVLTCTGCSNTAEADTPARFQVEDTGTRNGLKIYIITDTETGVQYMFVSGNNGRGALTKLEG